MRLALRIFGFLLPILASAQAPDAITVTATRIAQVDAGQAIFSVNVGADFGTTVEQVVQAIQSTGITAQDLVGVNPYYGPSGPSPARVTYAFNFSVGLAKFKDTITQLDAARRSLLAGTTNLELQYSLWGIFASDAAQEEVRRRLLPQLMADARAKAEDLAKAAGVTLGAVLGVTDLSSASGFYPGPLRLPVSLTARFAIQGK
jgi:uncharacterized protein DUF541